jgi:galactose mutarotase-like enzyme
MIGEREIDGFAALTLASSAGGGIEAAFAHQAGMVCCSLRHRGDELLGQRAGLLAYVTEAKTMGIPLLYPWANRLGSRRFTLAGREVVVDPQRMPVRLDAAGLPMHGLLAGAGGWRVRRHEALADGAVLDATFDFGADARLMAAFPFAHDLDLEATLDGATLTIATTVRASQGSVVPVAFGFHPYLRLPGAGRADWEVELPVAQRLALDDRMLPTGERTPVDVESGPLGARTFDDAYVAPAGAAPFVLAGGGRRLRMTFATGYPFAQVFAPAEDDVVAFEPMTAPANALVDGGPQLTLLAAGERYRATFALMIGG